MVIALRESDELVVRAASGEADRSHLGTVFPVEGTLSGRVLVTGRPERLSDATPNVRPVSPNAFPARAALVVPLRFRGEGLGVLAALDRADGRQQFTADDERLMTAFASIALTPFPLIVRAGIATGRPSGASACV